MLIAFHQRADDSISIHGENYLIEWNNDSTKIAVMVIQHEGLTWNYLN